MSAYGHIAAPTSANDAPLVPMAYRLPDPATALAVIPLKRASVPDELAVHLHQLFNDIVREGRTYPQENELTLQEFKDYFLAYDLFLGLLVPTTFSETSNDQEQELPLDYFPHFSRQLGSQSWSSVTAGCYYVKPNYPGRSSHCCNAGFIVDTRHRNLKIGKTLGSSYLRFAPLYAADFDLLSDSFLSLEISADDVCPNNCLILRRATGLDVDKFSVFNLVYVNNIASVKIWDSLGFTRAGLVPKAGRLKTADGQGEEFVDAIVYWRDFAVPLSR